MEQKSLINDEKRRTNVKNAVEKYIFFAAILFIPLLQFVVFYVGANVNSVIMSFQKYDNGVYLPNGIKNYVTFFKGFAQDPRLKSSLINSTWQWAISLGVSMPLSILVSYYIYLKIPCAELFKVLLMLPQIISTIVFVCIFRTLFENGLVVLFGWSPIVMRVAPTQFWILLCYSTFFGFANNLVLYLGTMSGVNQSTIEAAEIDGLGTLGRLWHVILPAIFPTVTVFIMASFAGYFTNQGATFSFFGTGTQAKDESYTFGYWLFVLVKGVQTEAEYPLASTAGVVFTAVAVPVTLVTKRLLEKYGPRED